MEEAPGGGEGRPGKGFRERKREDHALMLIEDLESSLSDLSKVRRILLELGRFYDPVLGGSIMGVEHQREIVEALEQGRLQDARRLIRRRYDLYVKDRLHLGRGHEG